jgi:hypothetical protein
MPAGVRDGFDEFQVDNQTAATCGGPFQRASCFRRLRWGIYVTLEVGNMMTLDMLGKVALL